MSRPLALSGRTCVVTGALGLLGREFADALAEQGANVVVTDRSHAECEAAVSQLSQRYPFVRVAGLGADISREAEVVRLRDFVVERFGGLDVLLNNAAIDDKFEDDGEALEQSCFESYALARWQRMLDVNVTGAFLCCQKLGSLMAERGSGSIVNVASTYGLVAPQQSLYLKPDGCQAFFKNAAYPTSKAALIGLTRYLASYWGHRGVRVNALCPGGVRQAQPDYFVAEYERRTPLGRMAEPDDYRAAVVFLAGEGSRYMTGASLVVDGGWTAW